MNAATNSRSNCLPVASAELEKRGYPKHWLALGVNANSRGADVLVRVNWFGGERLFHLSMF